MDLYEHGEQKFPDAGLLASSVDRAWTDVAAEVRSHPACTLPAVVPSVFEITIAVKGAPHAVVSRQAAGVRQVTPVRPGTVWLCPTGLGEDDTKITARLPEIMHLYLPSVRFAQLAQHYGAPHVRADNVRYEADVNDPLMRHLGGMILNELYNETSAGSMMVETAAMSLTARLAQAYTLDAKRYADLDHTPKLSRARLARIMDFIDANIDADITVSSLAEVACLSPYHFARSFKSATGKAPAAYLSERRLDLAKRLLITGDGPLADVALRCGFSSQTSFNRAFRRSTGVAPGKFRRLSA